MKPAFRCMLVFVVVLPAAPVIGQHAGDYNGDGFADLAFGVVNENIEAAIDAGVVHVIYGAGNGLRAADNQLWSQNSAGIADLSETGDQLSSGASGDFNGDGFDDLLLSAGREDVGAATDAGACHVLYGSASGLTASASQVWTQNSTGIFDTSEDGDVFGAVQAAGDFNGDGYDDAAIAAWGEDIGPFIDAGAVHILYGSAAGLTEAGSRFFTQDSAGLADAVETIDTFGKALAAGDVNGDGFDDLAIGSPNESVGKALSAGAVHVLLGSSTGLRGAGSQFWHQNVPRVISVAQLNDMFGSALAIADFNLDGFEDLAIGVPGQEVIVAVSAGAVNVLYGSDAGLTIANNQFWTRKTYNVLGEPTLNDRFGTTLAAADFDGDGFEDLAISVPGSEVGAVRDAGVVQVLYGKFDGLRAARNQVWSQDSPGMLDQCEVNDSIGIPLRAGDFNGDGNLDLGIGIPLKDLGGFSNVGAFVVIYGSDVGLWDTGNQFWHQDSPGILDAVEATDEENR